MLYSINWPNYIFWMPLLLEISGNARIVIVCFPSCNVMNFETFLSFLIKPFSYMTKKSKQMLKYRNDEKSFWGEIKSILHHFKGLSVARSCCRPKSAPLKANTLTNLFIRTPSSLSSRLYKMRSTNAYHLKLGANILWPKFFLTTPSLMMAPLKSLQTLSKVLV